MSTRKFNLHGVVVEVRSNVDFHLQRLDADFGTFTDEGSAEPALSYTIEHVDSLPESESAQVIYTPVGDRLIWSDRWTYKITGPNLIEPPSYIHGVRSYFAAVVISELIRSRVAQQIHASAVTGRRGGVAFIGAKKAGKSSTALLSLTAGADFVSNDITFLDANGGEVQILGIPQAVTLGPGAARWFSAHAPETGVPGLDSLAPGNPEAAYNMEGPTKFEVPVSTIRTFTGVQGGPVRLDHLVFPEPGMWLTAPRATEIDPGEAAVRMAMNCEAMVKWGWPPALCGGEYLDRLTQLIKSSTAQAKCWLFQWCPDHHANRELLREIVL
jgi:hypothetical protein